MRIAQFSIRNALMLNLVSIAIVILGVITAFRMNREAFPSVNFDILTIRTVYPGASAQEVELYVTNRIEEELEYLDGIQEVKSSSLEGLSHIALKLSPDLDSTVRDRVINDIYRTVERVRNLPDELPEPPLVSEMGDILFKHL